MNNTKKIVNQFPLTNLWKDTETIIAKRAKNLTADSIQEILKSYPLQFVVADVGKKLEWISDNKSFEFWKTEVKPHLADDINKIYLDNFHDHYAYVASEWTGEFQSFNYPFRKISLDYAKKRKSIT